MKKCRQFWFILIQLKKLIQFNSHYYQVMFVPLAFPLISWVLFCGILTTLPITITKLQKFENPFSVWSILLQGRN